MPPVITFALAGLVATACAPGSNRAPAADTASPVTHEISGNLVLRGGSIPALRCEAGWEGYADIAAGADVTVTDTAGRVIALGRLDAGTPTQPSEYDCDFAFHVEDVPVVAIYGIEVSHRGVQRFSQRDLENTGYFVNLTLG
jgi:hypothetical protein